MRCIFVGHYYHIKTKSSLFFLNFLKQKYEIEFCPVNPNDFSSSNLREIDWESYDLVVLWQIDFIYPLIYNKIVPIVIAPMYDATGGFDDAHFKLLRGSLVICFSIELYMRCQHCGVESFYWKYYPDTSQFQSHRSSVVSNESKKVFFWQRNRNQISIEILSKLFPPGSIDYLHVHASSDDGSELTDNEIELIKNYKNYKITTWFNSKEEYLSLLQSCNIYLAPRIFEGIGMGFLEAMSFGMCVIAFDRPTHNEYIINYLNGILYDYDHLNPVNVDSTQLERIRKYARQCAKVGFQKSEKRGFDLLLIISGISKSHQVGNRRYIIPNELTDGILSAGYEFYCSYINSKPCLREFDESKRLNFFTSVTVKSVNKKFAEQKYLEAICDLDYLFSIVSMRPFYHSLIVTALACARKLSDNSEFCHSIKQEEYLPNIRRFLKTSIANPPCPSFSKLFRLFEI